MKTNFTPAPWFITEVEPLVCSWTFDFKKMDIYPCIHISEMAANVSLMEVAPDMYKLLTECAHELELHGDERLSQEINELLAKACGE